MALLHDLNSEYRELHRAKEDTFWAHMMHLQSFVPGEFEKAEIALKNFSSSPKRLQTVREALKRTDLSDEERVGLTGWQSFFEVNVIESDEARALFEELVAMEGELDRKRRGFNLGYRDPNSGEHVHASSVGLALVIGTASDETLRRTRSRRWTNPLRGTTKY